MQAIPASVLLALTAAWMGEARASHQHHPQHSIGGHSRSPIPGPVGFGFGFGFGFGGGYASFGLPYYSDVGPVGPINFVPVWPQVPPTMVNRPLILAPMPNAPIRRLAVAAIRKPDSAKAVQLVTIGDRLFRAGNIKRASERYEQAVRSDPDAAPPRVRLAQVALVRGRFAESAAQLRQAVAADPGWLARAPNIEAVFAEPADFRRQISRLESRILAEPGDRDAWLVLGAELFLSGQTRRASDVFVRLTDRKPDPALAAFLEAATPADAPEK